MKNKNALTVRPTPALSELKRAGNLIRITERILGKSIVPGHNRTDEQGRKQGHWVEQDAYGNVFEGAYVDDKEHDHWVERWADGDVYEGPYVDGKEHGDWVERFADGDAWKGQFVNGERHGRWVSWKPNGTEAVTHWHHGEIME